MRFQVPQFIEVEDKIFGPLTFKQFIYLAGGAGGCFLLFALLPNFIAVILSAPVAALGGALAFYRYNDKPFIHFVEAFFKYSLTNKLYIWKKEDKSPLRRPAEGAGSAGELGQGYVPKLSESKIRDPHW